MRLISVIFFIMITAVAVKASDGVKYFKDGKLNADYTGQLVTVAGRVMIQTKGPKGRPLLKLETSQTIGATFWVGLLAHSQDTKFDVEDVLTISGYITNAEEVDPQTGSQIKEKTFMMALCIFNHSSQSWTGVKSDHCTNWVKDFINEELPELEKMAENGDLAAINKIGNRYLFGRGVEQDYVKAFEYYQKAASKGHAAAITNLASMYDSGLGVKKDLVKAEEIYRQAIKSKEYGAMLNLSILLIQKDEKSKKLDGLKWALIAMHLAEKNRDFLILKKTRQLLAMIQNDNSPSFMERGVELASKWFDENDVK